MKKFITKQTQEELYQKELQLQEKDAKIHELIEKVIWNST